MSDSFKVLGGIVGILLLIFVIFWAMAAKEQGEKERIEEWAAAHSYKVVEVHKQFWWNSSPFWWVDDNDAIYSAVLADHDHQKRTSWFRFRPWWGMDQAWGN